MAGTGDRAATPRLGAVGPLQPGDPERIGRYELSGRLGSGGMGTVYLGRAAAGGPAVAVKVVHPELADDPEFRARFTDEVAAARRVAPFCTARVLDADTAGDPPWLVTEFVDGVPLGTTVSESGPLPESTLHGVALGVAAALAAVHAAGVVHRDLKPGNVLLSLSGPRVIDFGIARALDVARAHTQVGMLVGTPGWMAPEQFRGGAVGPASDIFSWGSLVAYAATGRNPWGTADGLSLPPAEQAQRIVTGSPDLTGLDGPLRGLVERALDKEPARRPTARQLVDELLGGSRGPADPTVAAASQLVERTWTGLPPPHPAHPRGPATAAPGRAPGAPAARWGQGPPPGPTVATGMPPTRVVGPRQNSTRVMPPGPPGPGRPGSQAGPGGPGGPAGPGGGPARVKRRFGRRAGGGPAPYQGGPPYQEAPPAYRVPGPAPRRRWWRRKWLLIPLALLVALPFLPDGDPPAPKREPGLGQAARDGQLEFVVREVQCGVRKIGSGPLAKNADGQFCLAKVEVRNIKQDGRTLFEPFQKLHDSAGDKHGAELSARFYFRDQTIWDEVKPGKKVSGTMVFDIPADRRAVALELHDGIASGGVTIRLGDS